MRLAPLEVLEDGGDRSNRWEQFNDHELRELPHALQTTTAFEREHAALLIAEVASELMRRGIRSEQGSA